VPVRFAAEEEMDVADGRGRGGIGAVGGPEDQIAGQQGRKGRCFHRPGVGRDPVQPAFSFEPLILAVGAARGLDADLPEEKGDRPGAIHSRGIGPARAVGNRRMRREEGQRADEQFLAGGGEVGGPDRDGLAAAGRRGQQAREHHGEVALGGRGFHGPAAGNPSLPLPSSGRPRAMQIKSKIRRELPPHRPGGRKDRRRFAQNR
jgi:hypothetical protein